MKFCDCGNCMRRVIDNGEIKFKCACGKIIKGEKEDRLLFEEVMESEEDTMKKYSTEVENAKWDPTIALSSKLCEKCGERMKHVIVSEAQISYFLCSCD